MNMADQKNLLRGEPRRNEPMARHTSWRAGGTADRAYVPVDLEDMRLFLVALPRAEPVHVVGLGSNLLVRDGGLRGTVIFTHGALKELRSEGHAIYAQSGVPSPKLARFAALHELVGAEFMAGIPGTVGGALTMNAGCYGGETWGIVESVTTLDRTGQLRQRTPPITSSATAMSNCARPTRSGSPRRAFACRAATARNRARRSKSSWSGELPHSRSTCQTRGRYSAIRRTIMPRASLKRADSKAASRAAR